jgi:hypothetical protein
MPTSLLALTAAAIGAGFTTNDSLAAQDAAGKTASGVVYLDSNQNHVRDTDEKPLPDVRVSNGRDVVATDADGKYSLPVDNDTIVFELTGLSTWSAPTVVMFK